MNKNLRRRASGTDEVLDYIRGFHDNTSENRGLAVVSLLDNDYEGREAVRSIGRSPWGFSIRRQPADHGDFLSTLRDSDLTVMSSLEASIDTPEAPKGTALVRA